MSKVDFYILAKLGREEFACRIAEKAYYLGHSIYIHAASYEQALAMDKLLWTFKDGSFLPHNLWPDSTSPDVPILIGHLDNPEPNRDLLINLSHAIPNFFTTFKRIAEIVDTDENTKTLARERFRLYRDQGITLESHQIS